MPGNGVIVENGQNGGLGLEFLKFAILNETKKMNFGKTLGLDGEREKFQQTVSLE
jgi:hypothetical protein